MALPSFIRRATTSSSSKSSSSSTSTSGTTSPIPILSATPTSTSISTTSLAPSPTSTTLTKTSSRLSSFLSFSAQSKAEKEALKRQRRIELWEKHDRDEWGTPMDGWRRRGKGKRCKQHQDLLRQFKFDERCRGRSRSYLSGISPGASRVPSRCREEVAPDEVVAVVVE